jgi:hypothetical protein
LKGTYYKVFILVFVEKRWEDDNYCKSSLF